MSMLSRYCSQTPLVSKQPMIPITRAPTRRPPPRHPYCLRRQDNNQEGHFDGLVQDWSYLQCDSNRDTAVLHWAIDFQKLASARIWIMHGLKTAWPANAGTPRLRILTVKPITGNSRTYKSTKQAIIVDGWMKGGRGVTRCPVRAGTGVGS